MPRRDTSQPSPRKIRIPFKIIVARREIAAAGKDFVLPIKLTACHPRQSARKLQETKLRMLISEEKYA